MQKLSSSSSNQKVENYKKELESNFKGLSENKNYISKEDLKEYLDTLLSNLISSKIITNTYENINFTNFIEAFEKYNEKALINFEQFKNIIFLFLKDILKISAKHLYDEKFKNNPINTSQLLEYFEVSRKVNIKEIINSEIDKIRSKKEVSKNSLILDENEFIEIFTNIFLILMLNDKDKSFFKSFENTFQNLKIDKLSNESNEKEEKLYAGEGKKIPFALNESGKQNTFVGKIEKKSSISGSINEYSQVTNLANLNKLYGETYIKLKNLQGEKYLAKYLIVYLRLNFKSNLGKNFILKPEYLYSNKQINEKEIELKMAEILGITKIGYSTTIDEEQFIEILKQLLVPKENSSITTFATKNSSAGGQINESSQVTNLANLNKLFGKTYNRVKSTNNDCNAKKLIVYLRFNFKSNLGKNFILKPEYLHLNKQINEKEIELKMAEILEIPKIGYSTTIDKAQFIEILKQLLVPKENSYNSTFAAKNSSAGGK